MAEARKGASKGAGSGRGAGKGSRKALPECEGIEIKDPRGNKLIIEADTGEVLEVTITVSGAGCRKILKCVWNGRVWVCSRK